MTNKFDSSKVFFIFDVHFDHNNIIRFCDRPYNNLHEMNEELTKNWNETVPEDGIVFILGDFCFGNKHMWRKRIDRLNGTKYLILGNHDHLKDIPNECFESIDRMININYTDFYKFYDKPINQIEKEWIEEQANKMSEEIGVKITTSAWMRMILLKDMKKKI